MSLKMRFYKKNNKATAEVGMAIIGMAILLLLGSIFVDNIDNSKSTYLQNKNNKYDNINNDGNYNNYPEETYLFYLNETDIGRQNKVTESFPNIELGSKVEYNVIYLGNSFKLKSTPFSGNEYSFMVSLDAPEDIKSLLIYFIPERLAGSQNLIIKINNETYYDNKGMSSEVPININKNFNNQSSVKVTFQLERPKWYDIFNWNSFEINDIKIVEKRQRQNNKIKEFNFQAEKEFLERVELNMVFDCKETTSSEAVKVTINDYKIADFNPDCQTSMRIVETEIPINILNSQINDIKFESEGLYSLAYSLNKIYYNDQETYKFTVSNFNDIIDVVMYGDFDKEVVDIKINNKLISLGRNEIESIVAYLKYGTNEIEFLNKPLEISEFIVEKSEFVY